MWGNLVSLQLYPFAWLAHGAQKGKKKKKILAAQPTVAQLGRYLPTGTFVIWTFMVDANHGLSSEHSKAAQRVNTMTKAWIQQVCPPLLHSIRLGNKNTQRLTKLTLPR